jgi:transposase
VSGPRTGSVTRGNDRRGVDDGSGGFDKQHRALKFIKFLDLIDASVPAGLAVQLVMDNASTHKTPAVKKWLLRRPRVLMHFTPTSSSWLNLVDRWFAELTNRKLRRSERPPTRSSTTSRNT